MKIIKKYGGIPSKKLKTNGRLLAEFDIFVWQGKCQIWNIQTFFLAKKWL